MEEEIRFPKLMAEMKKRKENQNTIAKLLNESQATVSRKLAGKFEWTIGEVDILCEHFKKDYYQLFK